MKYITGQQKTNQLNPDKCAATFFTTHTKEYKHKLNLTIDNVPIPMKQNPKIFGLTFDRCL